MFEKKAEKKAPDFDLLMDIGIRLVPQSPTSEMCRVGCIVGDVDPETVRRIYNAMLVAAEDCPLHGDNALN